MKTRNLEQKSCKACSTLFGFGWSGRVGTPAWTQFHKTSMLSDSLSVTESFHYEPEAKASNDLR
eukprot:5270243-Amphidinium_carterae.1